jgi:membrane-bound lytic murein transglycosylase D
VKKFWPIAVVALMTASVFGQETIEPSEVIRSATEFLNENVDDSALDVLGIDADRTRKFLQQLEQQFQGDYVFDLGAFRETARQLLPVLEQFEETQPYAAWLKSRLDYFDVAEKLRPKTSPKNSTVPVAPAAKQERQAWIEVVQERPMPPLAFKEVLPLKKIFVEEKVPSELVWMAEVESSFDSRAKSPAGAAGLFQLMPATARSHNLDVGFFRDERLQPEKNARAAAQYLRHLHERFGDWRLALAAYNAGETRVANLLKSSKAKSFDAIANRLPAETQMYVPKVEAIIRKREGRTLANLKVKSSVD